MTSVQIAPDTTGIPEARDYRMFVDGRWVEALDGQWTEVTTPVVRGHVIGRVPSAGVADVDKRGGRCARGFPSVARPALHGRARGRWARSPTPSKHGRGPGDA